MKTLLLGLTTSVLATASFAAATTTDQTNFGTGNTPGSFNLGLGAAYYHFASPWHLENEKGPVLSLMYNFNDTWGLQGTVAHFNSSKTNLDQSGANTWLYLADGVYRFGAMPKYHLQPYSMFGIGTMAVKEGNHDRTSPLNVNGGFGMQWFFAKSFAIDANVRDLYTFSQASNDYMIGLGLDFVFGGSNSQTTVANNDDLSLPPAAMPDNSIARFALNSAKVTAVDKTKIKELAAEVKADPTAKIKLSGYADDTGTKEFNQFLSQKRAESVKYYLEKDGVKANAITAEGYGNSDPVADNTSPNSRALNRRVEANIVK